ncbi:MAG: hypothetical protein DBY32_04205 [Phascolarctobacterium sp.]|nr:MAG: hypothetical protein DBY32_04205 [Phascolarctobacterium sp.]
MTMDGNGIVPVIDVNRNGYAYGDGFGCGNWMWIFVLFALMGGGWNGWNRNGFGLDTAATFANGSMTRDQMASEFDFNDLKNGIRGVQNGLCDGFYTTNTNMLQGFNNTQREVLESRYNLGSQIAENRFAAQQCCCETNRNIDAVRAENYKNTCEITSAIHAEGEATRALINHNVMQELRDKLADRDRDLMTANFQLSQQAQSAALVGALRPFPQPAYITCSPYAAATNNAYGCGNCGC